MDLRVGVPPPGRFRRAEILFFFAVIVDCRLYRKNKNIEKIIPPPPARPQPHYPSTRSTPPHSLPKCVFPRTPLPIHPSAPPPGWFRAGRFRKIDFRAPRARKSILGKKPGRAGWCRKIDFRAPGARKSILRKRPGQTGSNN